MFVAQTMTETIARAEAAVRAAEPVAAADPLRPLFHFQPPDRILWINDGRITRVAKPGEIDLRKELGHK